MRAAAASMLLLGLLAGCDVVVSVGDHDVPTDANLDDVDLHDVPTGDALDAAHDGGMTDALSCHATDAGACQACQAAECCEALMACESAPPCLCMTDCVLMGSTAAECATHCSGMEHGEHDALVSCSLGACAAACP